jgi:hypothetical protein
VPTGVFSVSVGIKFTLTLPGPVFSHKVRTFILNGRLELIIPSSGPFTFAYPLNIIAGPSGGVTISGATPVLRLPVGSVLMFFPRTKFIGDDTQIISYARTASNGSLVSDVVLTSNMTTPRTVYLSGVGTALQFVKVAFVLEQSGSFSSTVGWPGSLIPASGFCEVADGCYLYIRSGSTLSTASLGGVLSTKFDNIHIERRATLQLGSLNSTSGFRFGSSVNISSYGFIQDISDSNAGIYLPTSSSMNLFAGASFVSSVNTFLYGYDTLVPGVAIGNAVLSPSLAGPQFFEVDASGSVTSGTTRKLSLRIKHEEYS